MNKNALIIFIKNPVLGTVKTRLAKDIGDEAALQVYSKLLEHTRTITTNIDATRFLFYKDEIVDDEWYSAEFQKHVQATGDLGTKMKHAFQTVFDLGFEKVLIIGSDCPGISTILIDEAFNQLDNNDLVIGPANDGGYYLLGLRKYYPSLFDLKEWSTDRVLKETLVLAKSESLSFALLEELIDIDTLEDLKNFPDFLSAINS